MLIATDRDLRSANMLALICYLTRVILCELKMDKNKRKATKMQRDGTFQEFRDLLNKTLDKNRNPRACNLRKSTENAYQEMRGYASQPTIARQVSLNKTECIYRFLFGRVRLIYSFCGGVLHPYCLRSRF